jgi:hypothetical protein
VEGRGGSQRLCEILLVSSYLCRCISMHCRAQVRATEAVHQLELWTLISLIASCSSGIGNPSSSTSERWQVDDQPRQTRVVGRRGSLDVIYYQMQNAASHLRA